jgi:hypothetical protein
VKRMSQEIGFFFGKTWKLPIHVEAVVLRTCLWWAMSWCHPTDEFKRIELRQKAKTSANLSWALRSDMHRKKWCWDMQTNSEKRHRDNKTTEKAASRPSIRLTRDGETKEKKIVERRRNDKDSESRVEIEWIVRRAAGKSPSKCKSTPGEKEKKKRKFLREQQHHQQRAPPSREPNGMAWSDFFVFLLFRVHRGRSFWFLHSAPAINFSFGE